MEMTEESTGFRACRYQSGCLYPVPELSELDDLALALVRKTGRSAWHYVAGWNGKEKASMDCGAVDRVADLHGVEMSEFLDEKLRVIEEEVLAAERRMRLAAQQSPTIRPITGGSNYVS